MILAGNWKNSGIKLSREGLILLVFVNSSVIKPFSIIYRNRISQNTFPDMLKKSIICPIHKKGVQQLQTSLTSGKVFERLISNSVYEYLEEHKLISADQSRFRANDSCVNQLFSIVHNIYSAFNVYPTLEYRSVFWICSRLLIKYDMRILFLNLSQWVI